MSGGRAGTSAVVSTVLAVGVLLLMVMFAARSGPERIFAGPLRDPNIRPAHPTYTLPPRPGGCDQSPSASPSAGPSAGADPSDSPSPATGRPGPPRHQCGQGQGLPHNAFFTALGWILRIAILAIVLWLLRLAVTYVVERLRETRWKRPKAEDPGPVDFDVLDDPEPMVEEIRKDADEQFRLLMGGEPRNAIVACWDRFEEQAERAHVSRRDWETSSEFTLRLLETVNADPGAVSRLERLYREARFSEHEIDESRRESAVEALRAIHASLGTGAWAG